MSASVDPGEPVPAAGAGGPSPVALRFAQLTARLLEAGTVREVLTRVAEAAPQLLPAADAVSVTVRAGDGTFHTPVCLHAAAAELDRVQYAALAGPCVDAARLTGPGLVVGSDLAASPAWPVFAAAATARGFAAVVSSALAPDPATSALGALNLYSRRARALDVAALDVALLLATHAALALAHAQAQSYGEVQHGRLRRATRR